MSGNANVEECDEMERQGERHTTNVSVTNTLHINHHHQPIHRDALQACAPSTVTLRLPSMQYTDALVPFPVQIRLHLHPNTVQPSGPPPSSARQSLASLRRR